MRQQPSQPPTRNRTERAHMVPCARGTVSVGTSLAEPPPHSTMRARDSATTFPRTSATRDAGLTANLACTHRRGVGIADRPETLALQASTARAFNERRDKSPGRLTFSDVTLERGTTQDRDLFDWFQDVAITSSGLAFRRELQAQPRHRAAGSRRHRAAPLVTRTRLACEVRRGRVGQRERRETSSSR